MKVCAKNRKALALLALDALEAPEAEILRAHVESCGGCRGYLQEIEHVAEQVRGAETPDAIEPSPFLHRRVRNRLLAERPRSNFSWRLVVPALAAMVFLLFILPRARTLSPPGALPPRPAEIVKTIDPTVLSYQMAANQSLEKLDAILTEQGNRALPATPIYRAGNLGNLAD
jgi:hypothetical protein